MSRTNAISPVLVIGAGPTGLTAAAELHRHGISSRVVDKADGPVDESRALAVHARTLEVFEDMGIVDEALGKGRRVGGASIHSGTDRIVHLSMGELETRHPYILDLSQADTERILTEHLVRLGGRVEWKTELVGIEDLGDRVAIFLRGPGGEETAEVSYVVACDGAHSACRHALGLDFRGEPYPSEFLLGDVHLDWDRPPTELCAYLTEHGPCFAAPLKEPGLWRIIAELPSEVPDRPEHEDAPGRGPDGDEENPSTGEHREKPTFDEFRTIVEEFFPVPMRLRDPVWLSYFRIHRRMVDRFRVGRVFLAGDSAHIHSPVGGQGMNTGIQDAYNLAWKLALVARDLGRPDLLESYDAERRPIAEDLLAGTDVATRAILLEHPVARAVRDRLASLLSSFEVVQQRLERRMAMLSTGYRESPIVGEDRAGFFQSRSPGDAASGVLRWHDFGGGPNPGDRAVDVPLLRPGDVGERSLFELLRGTEHHLLLFSGAHPEDGTLTRLVGVAGRVTGRVDSELVRSHVVVHAEAAPSIDADPASLLLDPSGDAHHRYGARADCLYLIRPDGHVGFRAQPARADRLLDHLGLIFER